MSVTELENKVTVELLEAIGAAFNRHDVDAIVGYFADDGVFEHAKGPSIHGARYAGKTALREFFQTLFDNVQDVQWTPLDHRGSGNKGYSEWRRVCTFANGERQDWLGLDIFTFRNGLVLKKDTYFKIVE